MACINSSFVLQLIQGAIYYGGVYAAARCGLKIHATRITIKHSLEASGFLRNTDNEGGKRRAPITINLTTPWTLMIILFVFAYNFFPIPQQFKQIMLDGMWLIPIFLCNFIPVEMSNRVTGVGEKQLNPRPDGEIDVVLAEAKKHRMLAYLRGGYVLSWMFLTYTYRVNETSSINPINGCIAAAWIIAAVSGLIVQGLPVKMKALVIVTNAIVLGGFTAGFLGALWRIYHPDAIKGVSDKILGSITADSIQHSAWIDDLLLHCSAAAMNCIIGVLAAIAYRFDYSQSEVKLDISPSTSGSPSSFSLPDKIPSFPNPTFQAVISTYASVIVIVAFLYRNAEQPEATMTLVGLLCAPLCSITMAVSASFQGKLSLWWNYSESYDPEGVQDPELSETLVGDKV